MTLLGLILAVGIVIDDAVVVLENVFRHMEEEGLSGWDAASKATKEISLAVVATTLSLVVIFAPIAFMSGQVGRFFNSFGFVVAFAILMSMAVSFTLTPMLCARCFGNLPPRPPSRREGERIFTPRSRDGAGRERIDSPSSGRGAGVGSSHSGWLTRRYVGILAWSLRHRWVIVLTTIVTFLSTPVLFMIVGTDFVPKDDQSEFEVAITLPEGTTLKPAERARARRSRRG